MTDARIAEIEKRFEAAGWKRSTHGKDAVFYRQPLAPEVRNALRDVPTPSPLQAVMLGAVMALVAVAVIPALREALNSWLDKVLSSRR